MRQLNRYEREWIDSWTVEEALAVYEFCHLMQEHLWSHHRIAFSDHVFDPEATGDSRDKGEQTQEQSLELPFDDIPF